PAFWLHLRDDPRGHLPVGEVLGLDACAGRDVDGEVRNRGRGRRRQLRPRGYCHEQSACEPSRQGRALEPQHAPNLRDRAQGGKGVSRNWSRSWIPTCCWNSTCCCCWSETNPNASR